MIANTVNLDDRHFKAVADKAREPGTTPEVYIHSLIEAATMGFDELLSPVRRACAESGANEFELDGAVNAALKAFHAENERDDPS